MALTEATSPVTEFDQLKVGADLLYRGPSATLSRPESTALGTPIGMTSCNGASGRLGHSRKQCLRRRHTRRVSQPSGASTPDLRRSHSTATGSIRFPGRTKLRGTGYIVGSPLSPKLSRLRRSRTNDDVVWLDSVKRVVEEAGGARLGVHGRAGADRHLDPSRMH